jgi:hypothetical protein
MRALPSPYTSSRKRRGESLQQADGKELAKQVIIFPRSFGERRKVVF